MGFGVIMSLLALVSLAGTILFLWGAIKILIAAFQESLVWGLACLIVPFAALVFVILNWSEVKQDFFKAFGGWATVLFAGVIAAIIIPGMAGQNMEMPEEYGDSEYSEPAEDIFAQPTLTPTLFQPTAVILNRSPIATRTPLQPTPTLAPTATPLQADRAQDHIGETLEFHLDDGQVFRAVLLSVEASTLTVQRKIGGGNMEYRIQKDRLKGFKLTQ